MHIFLTILAVIGIIFLSIIGLILLVAGIIVFVPIHYELKTNYNDKSNLIKLYAKGSWLMHIISFHVDYIKEGKKTTQKVKIKIFGRLLGKPKKRKRKKKKIKKSKKAKNSEYIIEEKNQSTSNEVSKEEPKESNEEPSNNENTPETQEGDDDFPYKIKDPKDPKEIPAPKEPTEPKEPREPKDPDDIIKPHKENTVLKTIKEVYNHPDKDEIIKLSLHLLKKLIRALKPKRFYLKGEIGVKEPHTTGLILSALELLAIKNVNLTGNFSENVVKLELYIKGKFAFSKLLIPTIAFALKKPIRKQIKLLLKKMKRGKKHEQSK